MSTLPYIPFANEVQANLKEVMGGVGGEITLGFTWLGGGSFAIADMAALATALVGWLGTNVKPLQTTSVQWYNVTISDLRSSAGLIYATGTSVIGTHTGVPVPNQAAIGITFQTPFRGRSFRGRNYQMGLSNGDLNGTAYWANTPVANWITAYQQLAVLTLAANWQHVILSRQNGGMRRTTGVATAVQTYYVHGGVVTQRRRLT